VIVENPVAYVKRGQRAHPRWYTQAMLDLAKWVRTRDRVLIMGILNVTPDSFYDGGRHDAVDCAVEYGLEMVEAGSDILDVCGESTRPGAAPISDQVELDRILPVIKGILEQVDTSISIDTTKASVAAAALDAGAVLVNDVSALRFDAAMAPLVAETGAYVVLMHMLGIPGTMQQDPQYEDVVEEIAQFLSNRTAFARDAGIREERILVDPGIGFGKTLAHNLAILRNVGRFRAFGHPVLIGLSRKSFLGKLLDVPADERLIGTAAANAVAVLRGADILRVHDVEEGRQAATIGSRLRADET